MKYVPNILSVIRMALSLCLLLLVGIRLLFFVIYIVCGLTDVLDGIIARKTNSQSALGARLDSAGDLVFFLVILYSVIMLAGQRMLALLPYILTVVGIRLINMAVAAVKFRRFAVIHTLANKAAGILIFASFGIFVLFDAFWMFIVVCIAAAVSALEETLILITSKTLAPDRKSIFVKERRSI